MRCEPPGRPVKIGRPAGDLRAAIAHAFASRVGAGPGLTCRDVVDELQAHGLVHADSRSERAMVRRTVGNMLAAGDLVAIGLRRVAGSKRPMVLYALADRQGQPDGAALLAGLLRRWPADTAA